MAAGLDPWSEIDTLAELVKAIAWAFPDQVDGTVELSQTGEAYTEFLAEHLFRPGDETIARRAAISSMMTQLNSYLRPRDGTIYWRFRPEEDVQDAPQIIEYTEDGTEADLMARKCRKDHNWKRYSVYCRLLRSKWPVLPVQKDGWHGPSVQSLKGVA